MSNVRRHLHMRIFSYWLCFMLVAIPGVVGLLSWLLSFVGVALPGMQFLYLFSSFSTPIQSVLLHVFPRFLSTLLGYAVLALVARRVWLFFARAERLPHSYIGLPKVLGYIGAWSFILAAVVLALSVALRAGSGVPAGMLLLPAVFCVPWAFFLTELLSFRSASKT